jgi:hypothetical protein
MRAADMLGADTMETYFDSRLDLLQRNLAKQSDRLKMKADMALQGFRKDILKQMKSQSGEPITDNLEKELQKFKLKARCSQVILGLSINILATQVSQRMTSLTASWQSAKIVRTREKVTFFAGVMSLLATAIMYGSYPQCVRYFPFSNYHSFPM